MTRAREIAKFVNATARLTNVPTPDLTNLNASNLTSGTIPNARISSGSVTQHVDLTSLDASNLTSGTIPNARISSASVTQHVSAVTTADGTWSPSISAGSMSVDSARYARVGNYVRVTCWISPTGSSPAYNQTIWTMGGLPITPKNTGTSDDVVGWGHFTGSGGNVHAWVLSGVNTIYVGQGTYAADASNQTSTNTNMGPTFKAVNRNLYAWHENRVSRHYQLNMSYFV